MTNSKEATLFIPTAHDVHEEVYQKATDNTFLFVLTTLVLFTLAVGIAALSLDRMAMRLMSFHLAAQHSHQE